MFIMMDIHWLYDGGDFLYQVFSNVIFLKI